MPRDQRAPLRHSRVPITLSSDLLARRSTAHDQDDYPRANAPQTSGVPVPATSEALGISSLVIGLTVVAIGTSLPEIATSVLAGLRGQRDIAVGNAVGSNLFNLMLVLGATALIAPKGIAVPAVAIRFDLPVMIVV